MVITEPANQIPHVEASPSEIAAAKAKGKAKGRPPAAKGRAKPMQLSTISLTAR